MQPEVSPGGQRQERTGADRTVRCVLGLDPDGPKQSVLGARRAFGLGIWISGIRCVITYLLIPFLSPVLGLTGIGPEIGLVASAVSFVALVFGVRRFFAADHRYRWRYLMLASAVSVLLIVEAVRDISALAS